MRRWIRHHWADEDLLQYFEIDDHDGWAVRQVDLQGPDRRPVTAATLDEVLHVRDHGVLADMQAYERRYGVLAEGDLRQEADEVTQAEFEQVWTTARQALGPGVS